MNSVSYLARQPIVDGEHRLIAYELLFRQTAASLCADVRDPLQAGVEVISSTLCLGTDWLLQGSLAFINLDESTLMSEYITLLPQEHVVFEILETVKVSPVLVARIQELRQRGFRFALDDFVCLPEYQVLMPLVDYIKLDVLEQPPEKTVEIIRHVSSIYKGKLLAEKVETREMFELCKAEGIEYFQGYYFAHPENIANKTIKPTQVTVLELMNRVRVCEDLKELEEPLRRDAALTFRLLRFVNSASFSLAREVHNIRQALAVIGLNSLYRWLSLLLVSASDSQTASLLARTAVNRGRICELLGEGRVGRHEQEDLFIVGLFSLLDVLMEMPMAEVLERTPLAGPVKEALLHRQGRYASYLSLAEACEKQDFEKVELLAGELECSPADVNAAQLKALAWTEGLLIES
ncbi:MAG: HDOD domain-containing protein [Betaproteobacteria bacterium]|nr:HDOD domain-containing protein [Betaproteobacteria bacterium]